MVNDEWLMVSNCKISVERKPIAGEPDSVLPFLEEMSSKAFSSTTSLRNSKSHFFTKYLPFIAVFFLLSLPNFAQKTGGGYSNSYLLRSVSARAIGMGGAFTAISNDPSAIYYNPAGLADLSQQPAFTSMFSILEHRRTHSILAWGQKLTDEIGIGAGINAFTSGSFISRDIKNTHIKHINSLDYSFTVGASYNMDYAATGVAIKYLHSGLNGLDFGMSGFAVDFGTKLNILDMFSFGLAMQNVGSYTCWDENKATGKSEEDYLPFTVRTGVAFEIALNENSYTTRSTITGEEETLYTPATHYAVVDLDAKFTQFEKCPTLLIGVEIIPHEVIAFRGGIDFYGSDMGKNKFFPLNEWGAGVSLRPQLDELPFFSHFDYSISSDYLSGKKVAHHISVYFEF